jgi:hypothetical protein
MYLISDVPLNNFETHLIFFSIFLTIWLVGEVCESKDEPEGKLTMHMVPATKSHFHSLKCTYNRIAYISEDGSEIDFISLNFKTLFCYLLDWVKYK